MPLVDAATLADLRPLPKYHVSMAFPLADAIGDALKECVEHLAGTKLSWWPMNDPEEPLAAEHVRVYSTQAVSSLCMQLHRLLIS